MTEQTILEIDGKEIWSFQCYRNEIKRAIDIKTLRGVTEGVTTIDPGYKNTGS
jgi:citrate synthase